MPTGWTPQGDPAIANTTDFFGDITIATRARNGSQFRLFWTLYNGSSFGGWQQYSAVSGVVPSDPALAVHVDDFVTPLSVFFRGTDNQIYGASTFYGSNLPFAPLLASGNTNEDFSAAPAVAGSLTGWEGEHVVVGLSGNQFHWTSPCPDPSGC